MRQVGLGRRLDVDLTKGPFKSETMRREKKEGKVKIAVEPSKEKDFGWGGDKGNWRGLHE